MSWKFFDPLRTKKDKNIKQIGLSVDWMNTFQRHKQQIISNSNTNIWHKFSPCFPISAPRYWIWTYMCQISKLADDWNDIYLIVESFYFHFLSLATVEKDFYISWFTIIIPLQNNGWTKTERNPSQCECRESSFQELMMFFILFNVVNFVFGRLSFLQCLHIHKPSLLNTSHSCIVVYVSLFYVVYRRTMQIAAN